jgi:hypothetical protein
MLKIVAKWEEYIVWYWNTVQQCSHTIGIQNLFPSDRHIMKFASSF